MSFDAKIMICNKYLAQNVRKFTCDTDVVSHVS